MHLNVIGPNNWSLETSNGNMQQYIMGTWLYLASLM